MSVTPADFENIAKGAAEFIAALAAAFGVRQYKIASDAELRLKKSSEIDNEIRLTQHFSTQMDLANGWGPRIEGKPTRVALATQQAAIGSISRLANLYPSLRPAAMTALQAIATDPEMQAVEWHARDAMAEMNK